MSGRKQLFGLMLGALLLSTPAWAGPPMAPSAKTATAAEDIRDIRGPIAIPIWWRWLAFAGSAAVLAGMGIALGTILRRRRRRPLAPHERALQLLEQALPLALAEQTREYALAASDAVRQYIEDRFGLRAAHLTTEEFFADLTEGSQLGAQRQSLIQFLDACDLAKFARFRLPREGLTALDQTARAFVLATAPQESAANHSPSRAP